jgi:hypothetical protein
MFHVICWCFCSSYLKVAALDCDTAWFGVTCIHMGVLVVLHMVYCLMHCVQRSPIGPRYVNYDMYQTYNTHLVAKGFCIRRCIHQCYPCLLHGSLEASTNGAYVIEWNKNTRRTYAYSTAIQQSVCLHRVVFLVHEIAMWRLTCFNRCVSTNMFGRGLPQPYGLMKPTIYLRIQGTERHAHTMNPRWYVGSVMFITIERRNITRGTAVWRRSRCFMLQSIGAKSDSINAPSDDQSACARCFTAPIT